jgi:hypothetical protein
MQSVASYENIINFIFQEQPIACLPYEKIRTDKRHFYSTV